MQSRKYMQSLRLKHTWKEIQENRNLLLTAFLSKESVQQFGGETRPQYWERAFGQPRENLSSVVCGVKSAIDAKGSFEMLFLQMNT